MLLIAIMLTAFSMDWQRQLFKSMGKDSTLSGRTVLWDHGMEIGGETPILGHGYGAFWVQGNPRAEQLWYDNNISARSGFHFHNLYMETFVELGAVGLIFVIGLILMILGKCTYLTLRYGMRMEFILSLAITIMFLIRSFVEVDLIGTFNIGPFLFFWIIPKLSQTQAVAQNPE